MKYFVLFNKIFNKRGVVRREIQTVATIYLYDHYQLNVTLKDYKIENMTLSNKFEIEKYLDTYKI